MMNEEKSDKHVKREKIRPLYLELQGYLSQAPEIKHTADSVSDKSIWEQYNRTITLVSQATGEDYSRFAIQPKVSHSGSQFIRCVTYRQNLGGIISHICGKYFPEEPAPFSGGPSTVITQTQQQTQSVLIQMVLDMQSKIDEEIGNYEDGSKEKSFMGKLKSSLSSITNVTDLIAKLSRIAKECGLNLEDVSNIFS